MIFILSGPGGAGKGTVAARLVERVPNLWLSRSWTTRARRPGEPADAYHFVDEATFRAHAAAGGFLEWVEFLPGQLSGTPVLAPPSGHDVLLEIDVRGAVQVKRRHPESVLALLLAPSRATQEARLRARGDGPDRIAQRLALSDDEERTGRALADYVVINDELARAVEELADIVEACRRGSPPLSSSCSASSRSLELPDT